MLPRFIRSAKDFADMVTLGVTEESSVLDFKETLSGWSIPKGAPNYEKHRAKGQKEICRDFIQFANADGGTVVIGVDEDPKNAPGIARSIVPIVEPDAMADWVRKAALNYVVPSTLSFDIDRIELPVGPVLAINVPPHADLAALYDRHDSTAQYLKRQGKSKRYLNPDEAMAEQMNTGRMARVRLNEACDGRERIHLRLGHSMLMFHSDPRTGYQPYVPKFPPTVQEISPDTFTIWSMGPEEKAYTIVLPYGCIEHVWHDTLYIGLILNVDLVFREEWKVGNAKYDKNPEKEWKLAFEARR